MNYNVNTHELQCEQLKHELLCEQVKTHELQQFLLHSLG